MDILILGDSWGVPNYGGPPGVDPEYHTEYLLRNFGHRIYNCAINGGSNLASINLARSLLKKQQINFDWIIWFHTESLRDHYLIDLNKPFYIKDLINDLSMTIYTEFEKFRSETNSEVFIIGGQAQLLDCIEDVVHADIMIKDWKSVIFNRPLPLVHSLCHLDLIEKSNDSIKYKNDLLTDHEIILDLMKTSEDFPDNCHPGIRPHKELVEEFISKI